MRMADWVKRLDAFLQLNDRDILGHAGRISHTTAQLKAETEYETFHAAQAALPQPVDQHFAEAIDKLKQIETAAKKKPGPKRKAGGQ
jgi:hypothetical protein